jgi:hypothetical protein
MDAIALFWLLLVSGCAFTVLHRFFVMLHLLFLTLHVGFIGIYHVSRNIAIIIVRYHTKVDKLVV